MKHFFLLLLFVSCVGGEKNAIRGIEIEVINLSGFTIDSVRISTSEHHDSLIFKEVEEGKSLNGFLKMDKNRVDGSYSIDWFYSGTLQSVETGYYTNGYPLEKKMILRIKADSISTQSKLERGQLAPSMIKFKKGN